MHGKSTASCAWGVFGICASGSEGIDSEGIGSEGFVQVRASNSTIELEACDRITVPSLG